MATIKVNTEQQRALQIINQRLKLIRLLNLRLLSSQAYTLAVSVANRTDQETLPTGRKTAGRKGKAKDQSEAVELIEIDKVYSDRLTSIVRNQRERFVKEVRTLSEKFAIDLSAEESALLDDTAIHPQSHDQSDHHEEVASADDVNSENQSPFDADRPKESGLEESEQASPDLE